MCMHATRKLLYIFADSGLGEIVVVIAQSLSTAKKEANERYVEFRVDSIN